MQALLLDIDGVLVKRPGYFSERLAREYNLPLSEVLPFFTNEFKQCLIGKLDLKEEVVKYFPKWGWKGSIDEFLKYWFDGETDLQLDVLEYMSQIRNLGVKVFLASDNEKYRTEFLTKRFGFDELFDGVFAACDLGFDKSEPQFFYRVLEALPTVLPEDIVFCDDDPKNVESAKKTGIKGILYIDLEDLKHTIADMN